LPRRLSGRKAALGSTTAVSFAGREWTAKLERSRTLDRRLARPSRSPPTRSQSREGSSATRARHDASYSSISAVSTVFVYTLASVTKHSCRAFADLGLTPDTGT